MSVRGGLGMRERMKAEWELKNIKLCGCGCKYVGRRVLDVKCGCRCGWPGKRDKARQGKTREDKIQYTWGHLFIQCTACKYSNRVQKEYSGQAVSMCSQPEESTITSIVSIHRVYI